MGRIEVFNNDIDVVKDALNMNLNWNERINNMSLAQLKLLDGKMEKHVRGNASSDTAVRDYSLLMPEVKALQYRGVPKASFGDEYIHRKNHRGQVSDYVELYGQGILVYWYGYLDTLKTRGYTIVDRKELGIE